MYNAKCRRSGVLWLEENNYMRLIILHFNEEIYPLFLVGKQKSTFEIRLLFQMLLG